MISPFPMIGAHEAVGTRALRRKRRVAGVCRLTQLPTPTPPGPESGSGGRRSSPSRRSLLIPLLLDQSWIIRPLGASAFLATQAHPCRRAAVIAVTANRFQINKAAEVKAVLRNLHKPPSAPPGNPALSGGVFSGVRWNPGLSLLGGARGPSRKSVSEKDSDPTL
jgi:hypothetical protein